MTSLLLHAQLTITPVFKSASDYALLKDLSWIRFDTSGKSYYACRHSVDFKEVTLIENVRSQKYKLADGGYATNSRLNFKSVYSGKDGGIYYTADELGYGLRGPIKGAITYFNTSNNGRHTCIVTSYHDSTLMYIDDQLVLKDKDAPSKIYNYESAENYRWWALSDNGNALVSLAAGLSLNGKIIATSQQAFSYLAINDKGNYMYTEAINDTLPQDDYSSGRGGRYKFHAPSGKVFILDSVEMRFKTKVNLYNDGHYEVEFIKNNEFIYIIDDVVYQSKPEYKVFDNHGHSIILYKNAGESTYKAKINGTLLTTPYSKVYCPIMDSTGKYAYYGVRNYYLYKIINGVEDPEPLTKYGVRPYPYSISVDGDATVVYIVGDTMCYYYNDELLGKNKSKTHDVYEHYDVIYGIREQTSATDKMYELQIGEGGYAFKGGKRLIVPTIKDMAAIMIVSSGSNSWSVYTNEGKNKMVVIYNGVQYPVTDKMPEIHNSRWLLDYYMDDKTLIFFAASNNKIYRYKIGL